MSAKPTSSVDQGGGKSGEACSTPIDPKAPAGQPGSLGSKSDCGGRPATDDSVVEAKDEMGPGVTPPAGQDSKR